LNIVTTSDGDGHYRLAVPSLQWGLPQGGLRLFVDAPGYVGAYKSLLRAVDQSLDVALDRLITLQRNQPVTATIWGDELLPGDNPGRGACAATPCKVFEIDQCGEPLTIRLQWSDPTAELGLYIPKGELGLDRYCCRSEIVVPYSPPAVDCDNSLYVGFERRSGTRPAAADSVQFTLVESASTIDAPASWGRHGREPWTTDRGASPRGSQRQTTFPR
jgi:hypothetical protein